MIIIRKFANILPEYSGILWILSFENWPNLIV